MGYKLVGEALNKKEQDVTIAFVGLAWTVQFVKISTITIS